MEETRFEEGPTGAGCKGGTQPPRVWPQTRWLGTRGQGGVHLDQGWSQVQKWKREGYRDREVSSEEGIGSQANPWVLFILQKEEPH